MLEYSPAGPIAGEASFQADGVAGRQRRCRFVLPGGNTKLPAQGSGQHQQLMSEIGFLACFHGKIIGGSG